MYHLIYTSHAVTQFSEAGLIQLLEQCRTFNKEKDISGMLLYLQGKFIQVLEGNKVEVNALYSSIEKDPRHKKVTKVIEGNSPHRIFKGWSMGFKKLTHEEFSNLSGFQDIDNFFNKQKLTEHSSLVLVFLKLFYEKNMVDYPEFAG